MCTVQGFDSLFRKRLTEDRKKLISIVKPFFMVDITYRFVGTEKAPVQTFLTKKIIIIIIVEHSILFSSSELIMSEFKFLEIIYIKVQETPYTLVLIFKMN